VIVERAGATDVDHVVVGSHGGGPAGDPRRRLGDVAGIVGRRSPVPVTVAR
jgi:nucleotide-binding universal stress UspA family protein